MCVPHFVYIFILYWILEFFHLWSIVNNTVNTGVQISLPDSAFTSFRNMPGVGLLDDMVIVFYFF